MGSRSEEGEDLEKVFSECGQQWVTQQADEVLPSSRDIVGLQQLDPKLFLLLLFTVVLLVVGVAVWRMRIVFWSVLRCLFGILMILVSCCWLRKLQRVNLGQQRPKVRNGFPNC